MAHWIDTHAHLQDEAFASDYNAVIERAQAAGVTQIVLPACNEVDMHRVREICAEHPTTCYTALGLHPGELTTNFTQQLSTILQVLEANGAIAIGEIGLDAFHYQDSLNEQKEVFTKQLEWAKYYQLPVLIHARNTIDLVLELLEKPEFRVITGVLHAFEGTTDQLARAMKNDNLMVGIGGLATFKNGLHVEVLRALDLSRTVLETDSPYLAPTPYRGKRNEPAYIPVTGAHLAEVLALPLESVAQYTTTAARQLFAGGLPYEYEVQSSK